MNFDPTIGLGSIITVVVLGAGLIGTWATFKSRLDDLWERMKKGDVQHEQNQARMGAIELSIAKECVKVDDFRRLEDRMTTRFEKVEHTVNTSATKTVAAVREALRDMMPSKGGRE